MQVHYAVKCLNHPGILDELKNLGSGFDIATSGEIEIAKSVGIDPTTCIHTHPIKKPHEIQAAIDFGINTFVFDNEYELLKFRPYQDKVRLLLRITFPNHEAMVDLNKKFGALPQKVRELLEEAKGLNLNVVGFTFHVGS